MRSLRLGLVLVATLTVTLVAAPAASAAGPAVANAGFEQGLTGWTTHGPAGAAKIETAGHDSPSRLTQYLAAPGTVTTTQSVAATPLRWQTFSAWTKSGGALAASALVVRGCGPEHRTTLVDSEADDGWIRLAVSFVPFGRRCEVGLITSGPAGAWASVDDVAVAAGRVEREIRGADLSTVAQNEDLGATYSAADGRRVDPYRAFARAGANLARLKVWVNPANGYNDLTHVVASAVKAHRAGMQVLIDFHYSDTWADPAHQTVPAAWANLSIAQMTRAVYDHTYAVLSAIGKAGVPVAYVQVGNEINGGMLWPWGQTYDQWPTDLFPDVNGAQWDTLAGFLTAGYRATKAAQPTAQVLLHLTNINQGAPTWWLDEVVARKVPFDLIGLSYYSYWHGSFANLQSVITTLSSTYDRDVLVVETAYPWTLADNPTTPYPNVIDQPSQLTTGYPATPAGQAANFRAVQDVVAAAPGGRGIGTVYWEPAWTSVAGNGWDPTDPSTGDAWDNQAVFDFSGRALPALRDFRPDPRF